MGDGENRLGFCPSPIAHFHSGQLGTLTHPPQVRHVAVDDGEHDELGKLVRVKLAHAIPQRHHPLA